MGGKQAKTEKALEVDRLKLADEQRRLEEENLLWRRNGSEFTTRQAPQEQILDFHQILSRLRNQVRHQEGAGGESKKVRNEQVFGEKWGLDFNRNPTQLGLTLTK